MIFCQKQTRQYTEQALRVENAAMIRKFYYVGSDQKALVWSIGSQCFQNIFTMFSHIGIPTQRDGQSHSARVGTCRPQKKKNSYMDTTFCLLLSEVAQWERAGLITLRSSDRNRPSLPGTRGVHGFFFASHSLAPDSKNRLCAWQTSKRVRVTATHTVGLVVEYSPATGETRVRFPDGVCVFLLRHALTENPTPVGPTSLVSVSPQRIGPRQNLPGIYNL